MTAVPQPPVTAAILLSSWLLRTICPTVVLTCR